MKIKKICFVIGSRANYSSIKSVLIEVKKNKKLKSKHTHGTGCTLSSEIAVYYSCGKSLKKSCENAIKYVNKAISNAPKYGKGNGPINHLNSINIIE